MSGGVTPPRSVTVTAVGHPSIRVSHAKTLELTAEAEITPRATCVAGVSAGSTPTPWPCSGGG